MSKVSPLQTGRFYRVKNPRRNFLCALCSAERQTKYSKHLSFKNYAQILVLAIVSSWALFPVMGTKSVFMIFLIWPIFEVANKMLYRKEIPCPYCGFDATWYRRDVNLANQKVKDFWNQNYPELVARSKEIEEESSAEMIPPQETIENEASSHI
jgi:hypothetical protein